MSELLSEVPLPTTGWAPSNSFHLKVGEIYIDSLLIQEHQNDYLSYFCIVYITFDNLMYIDRIF